MHKRWHPLRNLACVAMLKLQLPDLDAWVQYMRLMVWAGT